MIIPEKFDEIRPFTPEEMPTVIERLFADPQFLGVVKTLFPNVPTEVVKQQALACKTPLEFQKNIIKGIVNGIMQKASKGFTMEAPALDREASHTFVSNHRDIVLDSALLDVLLIDNDFRTTCEIAIGDNLLKLTWVKDIVRLNKSFIVQRGLPMRQMLQASKTLAEYMHFAIAEKHENIWIAQREGRAKDSDDRTAEAILKMMTMGGEGSVIDRLKSLHIVPLAISYEYDPCDFLKAKEFQQRRDSNDFKKGPQDDIISMKTGIIGYKGRIHYHAATSIDAYLSTLPTDMSKAELYTAIAEYIDKEIHKRYHLYANNYVALDLLNGKTEFADRYSAEEKVAFEKYLDGQIAKIDLPNKDECFLRNRILTMYANPAINYLKAND